MIHFKITAVAVIIGLVIQVCTSNPDSSEEVSDQAIPFTADELLRAKNAGISESELIDRLSFGVGLDEVIKMKDLLNSPSLKGECFQEETQLCEIFVPGHKLASNYTSAQDEKLRNVLRVINLMPRNERLSFYRTSVCSFISQPYLHPFSPKLVPHTLIRRILKNNEDSSGVDRVGVSKIMCCIEGVGDYVNYQQLNQLNKDANYFEKLNGLRNEDMIEFEQQWNQFDTTNIPKSIKRMRDFLRAKDLIDDDECKNVLSIVESSRDLNSSDTIAHLD